MLSQIPNNALSTFGASDPFPPSIVKSLKYAELFQMSTSAAGVIGTQQVMRLNSLYDPNHTGAGHQPYGFDNLSPLYAKYRVDRVKFKITMSTPAAANDMIGYASVSPGTSAALTGKANWQPFEWPNCSTCHLSSTGDRRGILRGSFHLHQLAGVSKLKYEADDVYASAIGADPDQDILLTFSVGSYSLSVSQVCSALIELEYGTTFFERTTLGTS